MHSLPHEDMLPKFDDSAPAGTIPTYDHKQSTPPAKFRIDVAIHDLLMDSNPRAPQPPVSKGLMLPEPIFPRFPAKFNDPGPETPLQQRNWAAKEIYRKVRGWLFPYIRSRVLPGEFHPITAYLFAEYKCNVDCWYC